MAIRAGVIECPGMGDFHSASPLSACQYNGILGGTSPSFHIVDGRLSQTQPMSCPLHLRVGTYTHGRKNCEHTLTDMTIVIGPVRRRQFRGAYLGQGEGMANMKHAIHVGIGEICCVLWLRGSVGAWMKSLQHLLHAPDKSV